MPNFFLVILDETRKNMFVHVYFYIFVFILFSLVITSLLYWPSDKARERKANNRSLLYKGEMQTKQQEHLDCTEATVKVTYCSVSVGYTVVIDWLTRAEWFLSPREVRWSLSFLLLKKQKVQQKGCTVKGQLVMFLTSTLL